VSDATLNRSEPIVRPTHPGLVPVPILHRPTPSASATLISTRASGIELVHANAAQCAGLHAPEAHRPGPLRAILACSCAAVPSNSWPVGEQTAEDRGGPAARPYSCRRRISPGPKPRAYPGCKWRARRRWTHWPNSTCAGLPVPRPPLPMDTFI
jgi:hypothetical protein